MSTSERLPAKILRRLIRRYGGFEFDAVQPGLTRGLPSRHVTLMLGWRSPFNIRNVGSFLSFASGLQTEPALVDRGTTLAGIHVFLTPQGARSLLGVSCSEIAGQTVHLRDLLGPITDHLQCRLIQASSWSQRFDLLDQTFIGIMQERDIASELDWAWNTLITTGGRARIEKVSNSLGWSRPHFAKRFRNEFGVSPKTVARIARFEQATAMIRSGEGRLANVAIASAFYDQAHMTREWQRLAGCSPKTWIGEELPFLQDYEFAELEYFV